MAWTTSAGARARPTIAEVVDARLKRAKYRYATLRRSVLRAHPAAFLAVSAVTLGVLALLLPTGFIAATLVLSGVTVAVYAAGANLADAVSMARTEQVAVAEPAAAHADIAVHRSAPDRETDARRQGSPARAAPPRARRAPRLGRPDVEGQSRPAHAAQRRHRIFGSDGAGDVRSARQRALPGVRALHPRQRQRSSEVGRGHARPDGAADQCATRRGGRRLHARACHRRRLDVRRAQGRRPRRAARPHASRGRRGHGRAAHAAPDPRQHAVRGRRARRSRRLRLASSPSPTAS